MLPDRFWAKIDKDGPIPVDRPDLGPCWLWTASCRKGYGSFWWQGAMISAPKLSYEAACGPIETGLTVDHLCFTTACVRPSHLEAVTMQTNLARRRLRLSDACASGHAFTPENTYVGKKGRECRRCHADRERRRKNEADAGERERRRAYSTNYARQRRLRDPDWAESRKAYRRERYVRLGR
jgi:hypothetical protein